MRLIYVFRKINLWAFAYTDLSAGRNVP